MRILPISCASIFLTLSSLAHACPELSGQWKNCQYLQHSPDPFPSELTISQKVDRGVTLYSIDNSAEIITDGRTRYYGDPAEDDTFLIELSARCEADAFIQNVIKYEDEYEFLRETMSMRIQAHTLVIERSRIFFGQPSENTIHCQK